MNAARRKDGTCENYEKKEIKMEEWKERDIKR